MPLTFDEEGIDVGGVEESVDEERTEAGVGGEEPTGDRGINLVSFRSFLAPGVGSMGFGVQVQASVTLERVLPCSGGRESWSTGGSIGVP